LDVTGGAATFTLTPLVEGIENLQIDYGIDTDGDGAPDSYTTGTYSSGTTAMTTSDWANVVATRVSLLARNNEATAGYTDTKTYTLGSTTIAAANDAYKRHVFTQLVRLINPSGRREQ
jgi:type IV pilus assembly protein PilW